MKKLLKLLLSRVVIVGILILIQVIWLFFMFVKLSRYSVVVEVCLFVISVLVALWIVNKKDNPAYKLAWLIPILLMPLLGGLLYLALGNTTD